MSKTPQEIFTSLNAGDLLEIPVTRLDNQSTFTMLSAVLRIGPEGELYLSQPNEHQPTEKAYGGYNPFRWDAKKGVLIDKDGDIPLWFTADIRLERGAAQDLARAYAAVPRLEHMKPEHVIDDPAFKRFLEKDSRVSQLGGIVTNGEAGSPMYQLALALDTMGIDYTREQAMGLAYFMERFSAANRVGAVLIALGDRAAAEASLAAAPTPSQTH